MRSSAVGFFLAIGSVHFLIGALAPSMAGTETGLRTFVTSQRTDSALYGTDTTELAADPRIRQLRSTLMLMLAGTLVGWGLVEIALAWFGLRQGNAWAYWTLLSSGLAVIPFWLIAWSPYVRAGVPLTLGDLQPFMWVPAFLLVPAAVLGFLSIR